MRLLATLTALPTLRPRTASRALPLFAFLWVVVGSLVIP